MKKITLKISESGPTAIQKEVLDCPSKHILWRAGRRSGKTILAIYRQGKYAITHPNTRNWYVCHDSSLLSEYVIPTFLEMFGPAIIEDKSKARLPYIRVIGDAKVHFKSANSNNSLRGRALHSLVEEEAVFWHRGHSVHHDSLAPQLIDYDGWSLVITSPPSKECPRGAEWVRRLEEQYREEIKNGNTKYAVFHSSIYDNQANISLEKIEEKKRTTDPDTWQVEYMGEYNDKIGQVYWEFDQLTKKYSIDPTTNILMRVRGLDWGLDDNTGCAWIALLPNNKIYIYDEHVENNLDVPEQANRIKAKTRDFVAWTCLDSSCWNRLPGVESVAKRFAAAGIPVMPGTKDLDGSVSDMKVMFSEGNIIIDPKCVHILQAIQDWQWGQHEPDILAGMRYGVNALVRSGKVMPPMRTVKPNMNQIEQRDEMERRMRNLNSIMANKRKGEQSFKIVNM